MSTLFGNVAATLQNIGTTVTRDINTSSAARNLNGFSNTLNSTLNTFNRDINLVQQGINRGLIQTANTVNNITQPINELGGVLNRIGIDNNISSTINRGLQNFGNIAGVVSNFNSQLSSGIGRLQTVAGIVGGIGTVIQNPSVIGDVFEQTARNFILAQAGPLVGQISQVANTLNQISRFNPISIIPLTLSQLTGPVGGVFDVARQLVSQIDNLSGFSTSLADGDEIVFSQPVSVARQKNPLRNYNSYNYIISFGLIGAAESNDPDLLRTNGIQQLITRSSGAAGDRVRTPDEGEDDAEYFIDNVQIDAVIAPNSSTGIALAHNVTFEIIEPYSMGKFIEAIAIAAERNNFRNYVAAPFALKIEFAGWNGIDLFSSPQYVTEPKFIAIRIHKVDFNVSQSGSKYYVQATAYPEYPLSDDINEAKTPINATGRFVHEVLETTSQSITNAVNERIEEIENHEIISNYDRFIVLFPKDKRGPAAAIEGTLGDTAIVDTLTVEQDLASRLGTPNGINPEDPDTSAVINENRVNSGFPLYQTLKAFANDTSQMNSIGLSEITQDTNSGGQVPFAETATVVDDGLRGPVRNIAESSMPDKSRQFQFTETATITGMIEEVVLASQWARDKATELGDDSGLREWFKIETHCYIEPSEDVETTIGRPPYVYVYSIHPHYPHEYHFLGTQDKPRGVQLLSESVMREYNYIYSGQNEDIIQFDINFDRAFMANAYADFSQLGGSVRSATAAQGVQAGPAEATKLSQSGDQAEDEAGAMIGQQVNRWRQTSGGIRFDPSTEREYRLAIMLHERLVTSEYDMVRAEMTIWGDPYFIPTSSLGNFGSPNTTGNPMLADDGTMSYSRNEIYIKINFKTPLDYNNSSGLMENSQVVQQFSGLYQVWKAYSTFDQGMFKQELKLIRMRGQSDDATTDNRQAVELTSDRRYDLNVPGTTGNRAGLGPGVVTTSDVLGVPPVVPNATGGPVDTQPRLDPGDPNRTGPQ